MLENIEDVLGKVDENILEMMAKISALREKNNSYSTQIGNRRAVLREMDNVLSRIVIPPSLISALVDGEIDEQYCLHVAKLSSILKALETDQNSGNGRLEHMPAAEENRAMSATLTSIAALRIRNFLNEQIASLTKPGTNAQIRQQSVLDRFRTLNHFLIAHAPHFAKEIEKTYVCFSPFSSSYSSFNTP